MTVGGAIAADVHGKNTHSGQLRTPWTLTRLLMADGKMRTVTQDGDTKTLFGPVGGMGMTGAILRATWHCSARETAYFTVDTHRAANIDDLMQQTVKGG